MVAADYKRVLVWGGWLRLSHACIGMSVLVLLMTGWLIAESPSLQQLALDLHYPASAVLLFGLVVRVVLLIAGREHERLAALVPAGNELAAIGKTFLFYTSLGKSPMPAWYAHNPLWKPLYLCMYLLLCILAGSGIAMAEFDVVGGFYLPSVHGFWASVAGWFSVLHIASVILHDYRNRTTDISAMVNGYRLFLIDGDKSGRVHAGTEQFLSPDSIRKHH